MLLTYLIKTAKSLETLMIVRDANTHFLRSQNDGTTLKP